MDIMYTNRNMEAFARFYVENYTALAAEQLQERGVHENRPDAANASVTFSPPDAGWRDAFTQYQTYLAVFGGDGKFIYGSEKLRAAESILGSEITPRVAREVILNNEKYKAAAFPMADGEYWMVGAVSLRSMQSFRENPAAGVKSLIALMALLSIITAAQLVCKVLYPIDSLENAVSSIRWGHEPLAFDMFGASPQVRKMGETLSIISLNAMAATEEHKIHVNDMVHVQEDERTKISRDIHDGPLQDVTALIHRIRLARRPDNTEDDKQRELDLAEKIAFATVKEMRSLCNFLNPPWLELGLSQALTELTERQSVQYGVKIFLGVEEDIPLSDTVTLALFRVAQEAVTNSVKHGEAKNIWIDMSRNEEGRVALTIQDDGYGFDTKKFSRAELRAEGHRGLFNMEDRMSLIGGSLKVISYKGEGTCIRAVLP